MLLDQTIAASRLFFPDLQIKYHKKTILDQLNLNHTIHFHNLSFTKHHPVSSVIMLLHELMHFYDQQKYGKLLYGFLYLFPQILTIFTLPLIFLNWIVFLPLSIFFLLPLPAYFRMIFEKRAYLSSLYVCYQLSQKLSFDPHLTQHSQYFQLQFKNNYYYFMWIFNLQPDFQQATQQIQDGKTPFQDSQLFSMLDQIIDAATK